MKKEEYKVPDLIVIHSTVHSHMSRRSTNPKHHGPGSPVVEMEPVFLQLCIEMGNARQPLTSSEGLELANSLIAGTPIQNKLIRFQQMSKKKPTGKLGVKYWCSFLKRHENELVTM